MSSFEWMELQTLTSDIAASRSRLAVARSGKDNRLTRVLEQEIATAERRRDEILANITNQVAGADEPAPRVDAGDAPEPVEAGLPEPYGNDKNAPEQPPAMVDRVVAKTTASRSTVGSGMSTEGDTAVWDQLTPGDIENAKNELGTRRA